MIGVISACFRRPFKEDRSGTSETGSSPRLEPHRRDKRESYLDSKQVRLGHVYY